MSNHHPSFWQKLIRMSRPFEPRKKAPPTFHESSWLVNDGILLDWFDIIPIVFHPLYNPTNQGIFRGSFDSKTLRRQSSRWFLRGGILVDSWCFSVENLRFFDVQKVSEKVISYASDARKLRLISHPTAKRHRFFFPHSIEMTLDTPNIQ